MTIADIAVSDSTVEIDVTDAPTVIRHEIKLTKAAAKALDDDKSQAQIDEAVNAVLTLERRRKGWTIEYIERPKYRLVRNYATGAIEQGEQVGTYPRFRREGDGYSGWKYSVELAIVCTPTRERTTYAQEFHNIVASLDQRIKSPRVRWQVAEVDGDKYVPREIEAETFDPKEQVMYAPLELPSDEEWAKAYEGMFGVDDYVTVIRSALEAAVDSDWENRVNVLLYGPPACGKTDICKRLKRLLGNEAVLEFDATSTTMAGAQQMLNEREEMPRVLIVEEIEKASEASLQWLLSVSDLRGEIRKATARGNILKEVHMVCIATVNNLALFNRLAAGALASRFPMPLEFTRPTDEILSLILEREINKSRGNLEWIAPTLDYAHQIGSTDPRQLIAICLTGRDRLLLPSDDPKSYQSIMGRVMKHATADKQDTTEETGFAF